MPVQASVCSLPDLHHSVQELVGLLYNQSLDSRINHWTACAAAFCTLFEVSDVVNCMPIITMESLLFSSVPNLLLLCSMFRVLIW